MKLCLNKGIRLRLTQNICYMQIRVGEVTEKIQLCLAFPLLFQKVCHMKIFHTKDVTYALLKISYWLIADYSST